MSAKLKLTKDRIVNLLYFLFFMGLAAFTLYYCFRNIDFDKFVSDLKSADYLLVAISSFVGVFATFARALRWNILINPLGHRPPIFNTYNALMVGYIANLAVPRIGELIRCTTLNKTNKIPVNSLFGTVVTERIFDFVCLVILIVLTFFLKMDLFLQFITEKIVPEWKPAIDSASTGMMALAAAAIIVFPVACYFLLKRLLKKSYMHKIRHMLTGLADGLKSIFKMDNKIRFTVYTLMIWGCYLLSGYLIFKSLPATSHLTVADALFFLALGTLGWVVPAPGGFGTFHFIVALGLTMYGLDFNDGIGIATLSHESQLIGMLFFGLIALISVSLTKINFRRI